MDRGLEPRWGRGYNGGIEIALEHGCVANVKGAFPVFLFLVFLALGFLGRLYTFEHDPFHSQPKFSTVEIRRARQLVYRLKAAEYQNASLEWAITELNMKKSEILQSESRRRVNMLSRYVGLVEQQGPGVQIVLKDSAKPLLLGDNPNTGIVHNTDLLMVVNELHQAGARAVVINNQPINSMSGITCAGPIVTINGSRVASPFVIKAMGNPERLMSQMQSPKGYLNQLKHYGIESLIVETMVKIPAYTDPYPYSKT